MITLNYVVRKHGGVSPDDFRNFWLNEHSEKSLQLAEKLGIRKYVKCETLFEDELHKLLVQIYGTATDGYDFVDQMYINDLESFKSGLARGEVRDGIIDLHKSCSSYVNFSRSDYWLSIEIPQVFSRENYVATDETNYMKVFYVPQRLPELSLAQAQLHWINCHGTLARQFIKRLPFDKYIQGHRVESKVLDDFKSMLG
ncbi:MAG: EthD domain-containing protein, partial [Gammaproteobacteria bacterium]|nr:EthD domain-containing protein [Gammaproteobacteria bacterium]